MTRRNVEYKLEQLLKQQFDKTPYHTGQGYNGMLWYDNVLITTYNTFLTIGQSHMATSIDYNTITRIANTDGFILIHHGNGSTTIKL